MISRRFYFFAIAVSFIFLQTAAAAQDEISISELKGNIQTLQQIVGNPAIPTEVKEEYQGQLLEKRGQLHSLLRQHLKNLQERKAGIGNANSTALEQEIQKTRSAISQLLASGNISQSVAVPPLEPVKAGTNGSPPKDQPADAPLLPGDSTVASGPRTIGAQASVPAPLSSEPAENVTSIQENYEIQMDAVTANIKARKANNIPAAQSNRTFELTELPLLIPLALTSPRSDKAGATVAEFTATVEESRGDKQLGGGSGGAGTTSLVTKGAVPAIFGFAVEHGGLERSQSGTSITFRGNPVGIVEALAKKGYISSFQNDTNFERVLRNFAFGLTFDTSRGNSNSVFTGDREQLSAYSFRYNFINQRDPRSKKYTELWRSLVREQSVPVVGSLGVIVRRLLANRQQTPPAFRIWLDETENLLAVAGPEEVEDVLRRQLGILQTIPLPPEVASALSAFEINYTSFLDKRDKIIRQVSNGWLVTAEYTNDRPIAMPSISNLNLIVEKGGWNGSIDLTANAAISFFNSRPSSMNRELLRDFHFSGQLDIPLGDAVRTGRFFLSLAGRYERLLEDYTIPNTMILVRKGDIGMFQAKLVIPIRGTAFKIPLSISFANRTELLMEREIRGNFGFTFDIDSILARFNPFSRP